jgi:hypothetical protein
MRAKFVLVRARKKTHPNYAALLALYKAIWKTGAGRVRARRGGTRT